ncbi:MAG: SUMF1/EgtB/PvdO family nonheme iron enzyme [Magnetococcales bacterium]|nr:SUMF1/EgtB/PvdO family nonheme iron enzyme [Magnetococcales bacterium]
MNSSHSLSRFPRSVLSLLALMTPLVWGDAHAADPKETIRALAASAEKDLHGHRFTQPTGMNALEKYQKILALDPDSPTGREGLKKIVSSFQELSKEAEAEGNPNLARQRTDKAKRIQAMIDRLPAADKGRAKAETAPKSPPAKPLKPKAEPAPKPDTPEDGGKEQVAKAEKMNKWSETPEGKRPAPPPPMPGPDATWILEPTAPLDKPAIDLPQPDEPRKPVEAPSTEAQPKPSPDRSVSPPRDEPALTKKSPAQEPKLPEATPKVLKRGEVNGQWRVQAEPMTGLEFVEIPGGCFQMGSEGNDPDEKPVHEVCVKSFWMSRTEVTNGQYHRFDDQHVSGAYDGHDLNGDLQPVVNVTWDQANRFAGWMSGRGGVHFRLPTEAEWEYAARAGTKTAFPWGDTPGDGCRHANVGDATAKKAWPKWNVFPCEDGYAETAPVGMFMPNGFGLYDMIGNVWEWVADWYAPSYYASSPKEDPKGPSQGFFRTARGGSWAVWPDYARTANRTGIDPTHPDVHVGFRLVMMP